jgi:hypothetical protein
MNVKVIRDGDKYSVQISDLSVDSLFELRNIVKFYFLKKFSVFSCKLDFALDEAMKDKVR